MTTGKRLNEAPDDAPIPSKMKKYNDSFDDYISNGVEVINIILEGSPDSIPFPPLFVYQLLDKRETIYGYKGLKINIYLTKACLHPYVQIEYTEKLTDALDLDNIFDNLFNRKYEKHLESFKQRIKEDSKYAPKGKIISSFDLDEHYEIYKIQACTMKEVSNNLQALMFLFIEGLSFIDCDPYWNYYLLYKVSKDEEFTLIGYTTTYESHQAVDKYRARISQMLVLPSFQLKGFGAQILSSIYQDLRKDTACFEITAEDPSDNFMALRDIYIAKTLITEVRLNCFKELKDGKKIDASNYKNFSLTEKEITAIRKEYKFTKVDVEQCFEMIVYANLDKEDEEAVRQFRIGVKKRFFIMHKETLLPNERLNKINEGKIKNPVIIVETMEDEEEIETEKMPEVPLSQRKEILHAHYNESIAWYTKLTPKILPLLC